MSDPKYDTGKGKQTVSNIFNKANNIAQGAHNLIKSSKKFMSLLGAKSKITSLMLKSATVPLIIVLGFCIVAILLCTIFVSPGLLFTSMSDKRTMSEKIRSVLLEDFDDSGFDTTLKSYMQTTYGCDNMFVNGGSEAGTNTYYYLNEYNGDNLTQRNIRTMINIGEDASKTCYVDFTYKNLPMFSSIENDDASVTADDIVYAYAQAVDSTISYFNGSTGDLTTEGDLGIISPADYGHSFTADGTDEFSMAGYYSPQNMYFYYNDNDITDKQKEIYGLPGYSQHSLGDTISIQWKGDNAPTTTIEDSIDANGNTEVAKGEEIPAACIAEPGEGAYGTPDTNCASFNQWNAAYYGNYVKDEDGKYYAILGTQNYTLRCNYQNAAGVKACFEDEKIKKTIEIAVDNGFILRYPYGKENETGFKGQYWTFTYVGKDLAKTLYNNGDWITLESYYGVSGSTSYQTDTNDYDYSSEYTDGIAGGSADASSLGVVNKLHYVSNSDEIDVKNCGGIYLKENVCTAYKEFQSAVSSYKENADTEEKTDTSKTSNGGKIDDIEYFDYSNTTKIDSDGYENENGLEVSDPKLTDEGKAYLENSDEDDYDIPTDDEMLSHIKNTNGFFSIEGDYSEWTKTSEQAGKGIHYKKKYYTVKEGCNIEEERRNGNTDENPCLGETEATTGVQSFDEVYTVDVPLKIDLRNYRKDDIANTISDAVDKYVNEQQGQCIFDDDTDNYTMLLSLLDEEEPSLNCTEKELTQLFWIYVGYYYNNNIAALGAKDCNKTYYDSKGNKFEKVCDDGTAFTDAEGNDTSLYIRIINGNPTTKKRLTSANVDSPEQIASLGEDYSVSWSSSGEAHQKYLELAINIRDTLTTSHGYNMVNDDDGAIQCVEFAWWRLWMTYPDAAFASGDGKKVAAALTAANPDKFELVTITDSSQMSESYSGSVISYGSTIYGHVLYLEKAEQENGIWYIWISEGNFNPPSGKTGFGTININKKYALESFLTSRNCDHKLTLAVPIG